MDIEVSDMGLREYFYLSGIGIFIILLFLAMGVSSDTCDSYVVVSHPDQATQYSSFSDLRSDMLDNGRISGAEDWYQIKKKADFIKKDINSDGDFEIMKEDCGSDPIPAW